MEDFILVLILKIYRLLRLLQGLDSQIVNLLTIRAMNMVGARMAME